jgi:hypothetical protein
MGSMRGMALAGCAVLATGLAVQGALAHGERMRAWHRPALHAVTVEPCRSDAALVCLHLVGNRLHDGTTAVVTVTGTALEVDQLDEQGTSLFARLPTDFEPGSHVVEVSTPRGDVTKELTLAATPAGYTTVSAEGTFDQGAADALATCPTGSLVVGGGYISTQANASIFANNPVGHTDWQVIAVAPMNATGGVTAYAICLDPSKLQ